MDAVRPDQPLQGRGGEARARRWRPNPTGRPRAPASRSTRWPPKVTDACITLRHVSRPLRPGSAVVADLTVRGARRRPAGHAATAIRAAGDDCWPLRAFRELDDALLGCASTSRRSALVVVRTEGRRRGRARGGSAALAAHGTTGSCARSSCFIKRTLKRLDLTARSFFALVEPGSCFAGTLLELALAADRSYMLDDPDDRTRSRCRR